MFLHALTSTLFPYTTLFRSFLRNACNAARKSGVVRLTAFTSAPSRIPSRSEEHTSELQSRGHLVCRLLLEKKNTSGSQPVRPDIGTCFNALSLQRLPSTPCF